jgi:Zn-dependent M28 family amino/carboxypeptidase
VPEDATTGCEATDFAGQDFTGSVALIRRGGCTFEQKSLNAAAAGAVAAVISNNTAGPLTNVTITNTGPIPVGGISQADGTTLAAQAGAAATVDMRYEEQTRTSKNVIAETRTGKRNNVVMAGAHLDAVYAGINDNGTGSAALLDVALKLGGSPNVGNRVRFAWWGAEELGLIGSTEWVQSLTFEQQLDIALYLNFDMVGSPNAAYFVYDGDDSDATGAGAGPYGSKQIEKTFVDFFSDRLGIETEGTDFSGRSDYGEFIAVGIPAGGLFTGAEGIKTAAQAAKWGGTAGMAYDPCYHQACDDLGNVDRVGALDRNLDAMAWSVGVYAYSTEEINGVPPRAQRLKMRNQAKNKIKIARDYVPTSKAG